MAGYDLTNITEVYTASGSDETHTNVGPYRTLHIRTEIDLLIAADESPTGSSFLLGAQSTALFHVEPDEIVYFRSPTGETGTVRITTLASAEGAAETPLTTRLSSVGELLVTETEREQNVVASYTTETPISAGTSWALLVDLDGTDLWPHEPGSRIDYSGNLFQIDKAANSQGQIVLGVVTRIDGVNADIYSLGGLRFTNSDTTHLVRDLVFSPSQIKLEIVGGIPTKFVTNRAKITTTAVKTGTPIPTAAGPGVTRDAEVGDLVIGFIHTAGGAYTASVSVLYHTNP